MSVLPKSYLNFSGSKIPLTFNVEALFACSHLGGETRLFQFSLFHGSASRLGRFSAGRDFGSMLMLEADSRKNTITLRSLPAPLLYPKRRGVAASSEGRSKWMRRA